MNKTKARRMRELLQEGIVVSPGVYDGYSARLVEKMGFQACSTTGAGVANSRLSQPDVGIMTLTENAEACSRFANTISIPMMADADTGYGNAITVYHAVQYFEQAGVVGINIEDQVWPKRCGHMRGKAVIDAHEMAKKIEAAVKARKDPDFIINARTDAIAVEGIEGAIGRAKLYLEAGADMVYPDAIASEDQIRRFCDAVAPGYVSISMGFGIRSRPTTPTLSVKHLARLGVRRVSFSRLLAGAALMGMKKALEVFTDSVKTGEAHERPDLVVGMDEITDLMGYALINQLENDFSTEEDLRARYKGERPDLVVRGGHS
ncbi:MAG TPA: isocitrate lyase/PEP mutase family protein [Burkholderiales bacterium]|nr:isocitrate lyase/PEP mutase family protein [Burkholderiales bacterium]